MKLESPNWALLLEAHLLDQKVSLWGSLEVRASWFSVAELEYLVPLSPSLQRGNETLPWRVQPGQLPGPPVLPSPN